MPPPSRSRTQPSIAVVVPCYRETARILDVLAGIGGEVGRIWVVDDACPDGTGRRVEAECSDPRVQVIYHERNMGVGGATLTGYRRALEAGAQVIVKLDGDGQMDPALIPALVAPILAGRADYAKGNRFTQVDTLTEMPAVRLIGNVALSFLSKLSSGYWDIFDPTNGFTAIHAEALRRLPLDRLSRGFFFESDMLFRLYLARAVVVDVPMGARYGGEESSLNIRRALLEFAHRHSANAVKRILFTYFVRDFTIASLQLVLGVLLLLFGIVFGAVEWYASAATGIPATAGTVILAALPVILGSQLIIAFLSHDTRNMPRVPLHGHGPPATR